MRVPMRGVRLAGSDRRHRGLVAWALAAGLVAGSGVPATARGDEAAATPPASQPAGPAPRLAILAMSFHGIAPDLARRYLDLLRAELTRAGYDVLATRAARVELAKAGVPPNCTVGPCLVQVGQVLAARRVLVGGVTAQGSNFDTTLTFLDTEKGMPTAQATEHCEVCTNDEGLNSFGRAVAVLVGRTPPTPASGPVLWPGPRMPAPWYTRAFWRIGTLSLGVAMAAVGGTLLWLDGSCAEGHNCPRVYSTTAVGLSLVGAGALVTAAGVAMLAIRAPAERAPRFAFGAGPGGVLLCGRF